MKNTLLFCTGLSGSGKSYFVRNSLPDGLFYNLKSATTRPMRDGECDGREYYFRDEAFFDITPMATRLWVNAAFWRPGMPKWLYGVPAAEVRANLGKNLVYDVIQPRYVRDMIDWFRRNELDRFYNFRVAYFLAPENNFDVAARRASMPNDMDVRTTNTCNPVDFINAGLEIDYLMRPVNGQISNKLMRHVAALNRARRQR